MAFLKSGKKVTCCGCKDVKEEVCPCLCDHSVLVLSFLTGKNGNEVRIFASGPDEISYVKSTL